MPAYHSGSLSRTGRPDFNLPLRPTTPNLTPPLAPRNLMVTSPYKIGSTDIRWDNPNLIPQNSGLNIVGVNIYRSLESPYGPYELINTTPVEVLFYRDETKEVLVTEDATPTLKYNLEPDKRWLIYTQRRPIIQPETNGQASDRIQDVRVEIDDGDGSFIEVPAFSVTGAVGEITLISSPTYDYTVDQILPPRLPWPPTGRVRLTYVYLGNQVVSSLNQRIYYKAVTVAVDPNDHSKRIETPLDEVEFKSTFDIDEVDWIWREALKRNFWILEQAGERVKVFTKKNMGEKCLSYEYSHGQSHQDCLTCFPAGQQVTLFDGSSKNIEEISVGEKVLTIDGSIREVTEIFERNYLGEMHTLKFIGKTPIQCTEEHPLFILKKEDACCDRYKKGFSVHKCVPMQKWQCNKNGIPCKKVLTPQWVPAKEITKGDYVLVPKIKTNKRSFSLEEMFLFGLYTAEGYIHYKKRKNNSVPASVVFCLGGDEESLITYTCNLIKNLYGKEIKPYRDKRGKNSIRIDVNSVDIAQKYLYYCGTGSHTKKLHADILNCSKSLLLNFMSGYLMGDGCVLHTSGLKYNTVSKNLSSQIEIILSKLNIPVNVRRIYHEEKRENWGRSGWIFNGTINSTYSQKIKLLFNKNISEHIVKTRQNQTINFGEFIGHRVTENTIKKYADKVFNLEVAVNNTYLVNNIVVHNCFGTNYIGGFFGPIDIIIAPPEAEKSIELLDMGLHIRYSFETWTGPFPLLNERDIIVRQSNERYIVGPVNYQGSRGAIYQQHFTIEYIDEGDIRYKLPVDGGQTSTPESTDLYREDLKSPASPVIPVKPMIPQERLIKGRTVTFENIQF